eukprot:2663838-Amphidinium_carterae.1
MIAWRSALFKVTNVKSIVCLVFFGHHMRNSNSCCPLDMTDLSNRVEDEVDDPVVGLKHLPQNSSLSCRSSS